MMKRLSWAKRPILLSLTLAIASPALAQTAPVDKVVDTRLRKLESEISALQRKVFPGGDGKYFAPQVEPGAPVANPTGTPATSAVTDILTRMDALEAQVQRLTAQQEESVNKLARIEARLTALEPAAPAPAATPAATASGAATADSPAALVPAGFASQPSAPQASAPQAGAAQAVTPVAKPAAPLAAKPTPPAAKPAATAPSAQRIAAVQKIEKPQSNDPAEDAYSYGFRLWEAKFYPEAQQQLKLYLQKYPKHKRGSYARNLLGRTYLEDANPREAASWFLQNYQADKKGDRAADSLLYLAEAMRQLKDSSRACVALSQFADDYAADAAGRLKGQYDKIRGTVKCN